jgi:HSP20 family protein
MDLPAGKRYKTGEIKAEMKNGVLKMVVPKVKEDDRIDVLLVKVE